jgi:hypothetical protein
MEAAGESARALQLMSQGEVDILGVVRFALERRQFDDARISAVPFPDGAPRTARWFEAISFMETEPDRLRELVVTLLGAAHSYGLELVLWLHGEPHGISFRYGVLVPEESGGTSSLGPDFQRMLEGAFPGIRLSNMPTGSPTDRLQEDLVGLQTKAAAGLLVGIPCEREETPVETRLDDVLNGLAGRAFDLVIQATPAERHEIDLAVSNLSVVADLSHRLTRQQLAISDSAAFTSSVTEGVNMSWSSSETLNWSTSASTGTSRQVAGHHSAGMGAAAGAVLGGIIGAVVGAPSGPGAPATAVAGAKVGALVGGHAGRQLGRALKPPVQETKTTGTSHGRSESTQQGGGNSSSRTDGHSRQWGQSVSIERLNRQAGLIEEIAEAHLKRARQMKSFGGWYVSVCVATSSEGDLRLASSLLAGALRGDLSYLETPRLIIAEKPAVHPLLQQTAKFRGTRFGAVPHPLLPRGEQPSTLLSSGELAQWFRPPSSPVVGVDVRPAVTFAATAPRYENEKILRLGHLVASGRHLQRSPVFLPTKELARHCFVAGTTGAGKTTTLVQILSQLANQGIPFLVVEPAKTEYRALFEELVANNKRPLRLTLRGEKGPYEQPLRLNPWKAPAGTLLGRHVEGMKVLLRSCFAMQESLPQILERAIFDLYSKLGWSDLSEVVPIKTDRRFPTFADFVAKAPGGTVTFLQEVVRGLHYRAEVTGNLTAAVTVRMESFLRGIKGHLFSEEDDPFDDILNRPTFIELADLNEPDIKRFLLGAIVLRLASELQARHARTPATTLRHVTVLEEAHHFLRTAVGHGPGAELARESNLLLADAFAEMRGYGEGIIVADQAPAELAPAVLRNTNIKIAHRLMYQDDCDAMGDAMGLNDAQKLQLRMLGAGECVIQAPSIPRPIQCRVQKWEET